MAGFKHILAFVSGLPTDTAVLNAAIGIARASRAHVDVVFVMPDAQQVIAAASTGGGMPVALSEFVESEERRIAECERFARRAFDAVAGGLPAVAKPTADPKLTVNFRTLRGRLDKTAAAEGQYADLSISARPADAADARHNLLAETLLFETGRPILLVPPGAPAAAEYKHVMVGWSETPHTVRAVHEAIPLLSQAKSVDVVGIGKDHDPGIIAERLRAMNIPANAVSIETDGIDPSEILLRQIEQRNTELFVMGGYGHSRIREYLLGGVTKTMLHECDTPIFACH